MATLTLKKREAVPKTPATQPENKSVLICKTVRIDAIGKYAVLKLSGKSKHMHMTMFHPSLELAMGEANRLKALRPEHRFVVMHVIGEAE